MRAALDALRARLPGNEDAIAVCDSLGREIEIFDQYGDWYTYGFYVMQAE